MTNLGIQTPIKRSLVYHWYMVTGIWYQTIILVLYSLLDFLGNDPFQIELCNIAAETSGDQLQVGVK